MNILLLAPQPFYQERGTPIAVRLLAETLVASGHRVDLVTYGEGQEIALPSGLRLWRARHPAWLRGVRPGFSLKKLGCDVFLYALMRRLIRSTSYDVIHAVEESVFLARRIQRRVGIPYVYDMDSSLPAQVLDKMPWLRWLRPALDAFETRACRHALCVVAVCPALAQIAQRAGAHEVFVLPDVPLGGRESATDSSAQGSPLKIPWRGTRFLYVGNLEPYQGVELLLRAFAEFQRLSGEGTLAVVGGPLRRVKVCQRLAQELGLGERVSFPGPVPVSRLSSLLREADVLVSPRLTGINTPMKIYSYLQSGKPLLATAIEAHTQVLTPETAYLTPPEPEAMGHGMLHLARDPELRQRLGSAGRKLVERDYSVERFRERVYAIYSWIVGRIPCRAIAPADRPRTRRG